MKIVKKTSKEESPGGESEDLIWGINAVGEALQSGGCISELFVQRGKASPRLQQLIDQARAGDITIRFVETDKMPVSRHTRHQGVVARQSEARPVSLENLLTGLRENKIPLPPRLLVLDSIQDPRNLGSILRSALAAGFVNVIMTRERSVPITGTVARTSAGALAHLRLCRVVNLAETLRILKEHGFWIYGAVAESEVASAYSVDFSGPICLVIGSEGKGIRPLVRKQCDVLVTIPMCTPFNSLNASVAAAILMFEISRRIR